MPPEPPNDADQADTPGSTMTARLWQDGDWTARVIKNEDDDGWAVEMMLRGQAEPALVGPWTMGRDKKNPKPLDGSAFITLVKTAREVLRRHEQQNHARLHRSLEIDGADGPLRIELDIVPDDDDPHALLSAHGTDGSCLARCRVPANWRLDRASALAWAESRFARPR